MGEILSGQSFVVVILTFAVGALWKSMQDSQKKLVEIIENNTRTQHELKSVIEKTSQTADQAFKMMHSDVLEHNREVLSKLDFLITVHAKEKS